RTCAPRPCWLHPLPPRPATYSRIAAMRRKWEQERAPETADPGSEIDVRYAWRRDLTETLEELYASEILPTITSDATRDRQYKVLTEGLNFAFVDAMNYAGDTSGLWAHTDRASHLVERLHRVARRKPLDTDYGRRHAAPQVGEDNHGRESNC